METEMIDPVNGQLGPIGVRVTSNIGEEVRTESGHTGILICSDQMGITPMDLFNDIVTNPADMQIFLGANNCKQTDNIALRKMVTSGYQMITFFF